MGLVILDSKVQAAVERFFIKLEKFFPEHKVFALDSIDKSLRETLSDLTKKTGCSSSQEFLGAYGYEMIAGDAVKQLRNKVVYTPGNEPEVIKSKVESMVSRLKEAYPDGVVRGSLQNDHKNLSKSVSGLYQWLGYPDATVMLEAYGFARETLSNTGGRPSNDYQALIDELIKRYEGVEKPSALGILLHDNPDLTGNIKSLQNKSNELFGMSLAAYFKEIGLLQTKEVKVKEVKEKVVKEKVYHYLELEINNEIYYCVTTAKSIKVDDYVEAVSLYDHNQKIGKVVKTCYFTLESDLPKPINEMLQLIRKLNKADVTAYLESFNEYTYCLVELDETDTPLYYRSEFENIQVHDVVKVPYSYYGLYEGVVKTVEKYTGDKVPFPVKRTKKIYEIVYSVATENKYIIDEVNIFMDQCSTKSFVPEVVDTHALDTITYFASAVFRGRNDVVYEAVRYIHSNEKRIEEYITHVAVGISQFECPNIKVLDVLAKYPSLKATFFAECWRDGKVYLAYSESGYSTVTSMRYIDTCDFYTKDRWTLMKDPCLLMEEEKGLWEACDYVIDDVQYVANQVIPSKPYPKKSMFGPCEIIQL